MTHEELKEMFHDGTYDSILSLLYKRGRKCGIDGLRIVSAKQVNNAIEKLTNRLITESDLIAYCWGNFAMYKTPDFGQLVVSKK